MVWLKYDSRMDLARTLSKLIQAESPSGCEGPAAGVLMETLEAIGFSPRLDEAGNLEAVIGTDGPEIVLTGHMDIVPPGDEAAWPHPPFSGQVEDGVIWGRGAVDMKGPLVGMMGALHRLKGERLPGRVRFLATVQEEVGGLGARHATKRLAPRAVILGEPSRNRVVRGNRGRGEIWADFSGDQGHAAIVDGNNALYALGRFLNDLEAHREEDPAGLRHPSLRSAQLRLNPTVVECFPATSNVLPGVARVILDLRFDPGADTDQLLRGLRELAGDASVYVPEKVWSSGSVTMTIPMMYPPYHLEAEHPLLRRALEALDQPEAGFWPFTTDAPYLGTLAPVIGYGPGDPALAHTTHEHLHLADLEQSAEDYARLVRALLN